MLSEFKAFIAKVKEEAVGERVIRAVKPGQKVVKIVYDALVETLGGTGGPVDLIEHGITGLLIDTADAHELLEAVATLRNHSSFDLMQLAARKSVEHRTWDYINAQLISHYQDAIDQLSKKRGLVA